MLPCSTHVDDPLLRNRSAGSRREQSWEPSRTGRGGGATVQTGWPMEDPGPVVSWWARRPPAPSAVAGGAELWPLSLPSRRASPPVPSTWRTAPRPITVPRRNSSRARSSATVVHEAPLSSSLSATPGQPRHLGASGGEMCPRRAPPALLPSPR